MSMHPYVNMGYGYELDVNDDNVFDRLVEMFPKEATLYRDEDGGISEKTGFLYEVSENCYEKYPGLSFVVVSDDDIETTLLVVDNTSKRNLYDKYDGNDSGVIRPQKIYGNTTKELTSFASDFELKSEAEILIWTYWA